MKMKIVLILIIVSCRIKVARIFAFGEIYTRGLWHWIQNGTGGICIIARYTKRTRDADLIGKAKDILRLLTLAVVAPAAVTILIGRNWEIVRLGYQKGGLCSQFGINKEKKFERLKPLPAKGKLELCCVVICTYLDTFLLFWVQPVA